MSLRWLTAIVVVVVLIGPASFCLSLGRSRSTGGVVRLDMTRFGERWIEYIATVALTAMTPYALYYLTETSK